MKYCPSSAMVQP